MKTYAYSRLETDDELRERAIAAGWPSWRVDLIGTALDEILIDSWAVGLYPRLQRRIVWIT